MSEPVVLEQRQVGTVVFKLVRIAEPERYIMTLVDTFGVASTMAGGWAPSEVVIEQAFARHLKFSQVITRRN